MSIGLRHILFIGALLVPARGRSSSAQTASGSTTASHPTPNPHWSNNGCLLCHPNRNGELQPIAVSQIDPLCVSCHNGRRAKAERHPINRTFGSPQIRLPDDWPAHDRVLGCATCHDIRSACDHDRARPVANPTFLRGHFTGSLQTFCAHCHVAGPEHGLHNPHVMLSVDHSPLEQSCLYCHARPSDLLSRTTRTGRAMLRSDEPGLCLTCHREHIDYFEPGHLGARPSATMLLALAEFEKARAGTSRGLPLASDGAITCSTCHNPHQAGLFPTDSVLSFGAMPSDAERSGSGLRWKGAELCVACHYYGSTPAADR